MNEFINYSIFIAADPEFNTDCSLIFKGIKAGANPIVI